MIIVYKNTLQQKGLKKLKGVAPMSWVNVVAPSEGEVKYLSKALGVPVDALQDSLDEYELPRLKFYGDSLMVILRAPLEKQGTYATIPFTLIMGSFFITTIVREKMPILDDILNQQLEVITTQKSNFLIKISLRIIEY